MCVCEREKEDRARQKHIWVSSCHYARTELFPSTLWVPEIKVRSSDLAEQVTLPAKSLGWPPALYLKGYLTIFL